MEIELNIPAKVRAAIYLLLLVGSPVMIYLQTVSIIGEPEMNLWLAVSAAIGLMARLNTPVNKGI